MSVCLIEREYPASSINKPFLYVEVAHAVMAELLIEKLLEMRQEHLANPDYRLSHAVRDVFVKNTCACASLARARSLF